MRRRQTWRLQGWPAVLLPLVVPAAEPAPSTVPLAPPLVAASSLPQGTCHIRHESHEVYTWTPEQPCDADETASYQVRLIIIWFQIGLWFIKTTLQRPPVFLTSQPEQKLPCRVALIMWALPVKECKGESRVGGPCSCHVCTPSPWVVAPLARLERCRPGVQTVALMLHQEAQQCKSVLQRRLNTPTSLQSPIKPHIILVTALDFEILIV